MFRFLLPSFKPVLQQIPPPGSAQLSCGERRSAEREVAGSNPGRTNIPGL